jgi:hypothetical protein
MVDQVKGLDLLKASLIFISLDFFGMMLRMILARISIAFGLMSTPNRIFGANPRLSRTDSFPLLRIQWKTLALDFSNPKKVENLN